MVVKVVVMALNARRLESLVGTGKVEYLSDGDGLYLKLSANGTKTWFLRAQASRKRSWIYLGRFPALSLLEARNKAAQRRALGAQAVRTVEDAWKIYLPYLRRAYKRHDELQRRYEKDLIGSLGPRRLSDVTRADVAEVLQRVVDRGSLVLANRVLADAKRLFSFCVEKGWITSSPASLITRRSVGGRERSKELAMEMLELAEFILKLKYTPRMLLRTRLALGLVALTGQRPTEVLDFDQTEIAGSMWTIPAERTKPKREQKVYLSPQARHLFRLAVRHFGRKPWRGMTHNTLSKAMHRLELPRPFTTHDLRRTMATRLSDLGVAPHIIEKMLNHRMKGVWAIYNRAEYLPERREAWRLWGRHLAKLRRQNEKTTGARRLPHELRVRAALPAPDARGSELQSPV